MVPDAEDRDPAADELAGEELAPVELDIDLGPAPAGAEPHGVRVRPHAGAGKEHGDRHLRDRGGAWANVFAPNRAVRAAVNQDMAQPAAPLKAGDEVAFFPPVTGG